jgi:hypothetical protein
MPDLPQYLTRNELVELLRAHGFPITKSTLDKMCMQSRGGGPPVAGYWPGGRNDRPLYDPVQGLTWAQGRLLKSAKQQQSQGQS